MTRSCTLREMIEAMAHLPGETTFRWYQVSLPGPGWATAGDSLHVTLEQVRKELSE